MLTLYLTQPVACPLQSGEDENEATLLAFYQAQCAQGGKRALASPLYGTGRRDDNSIGAVTMPLLFLADGKDEASLNAHITKLTGWGNHFEICCDDDVVTGVSTTASNYSHDGRPVRVEAGEMHAAAAGEMVQLTCTDFDVDHCAATAHGYSGWLPIIDCGPGGQCNAGMCTCADGYSGERCGNADHCSVAPIIDCGRHGVCSAGRCYCADGYSGERCTVQPGGGG